MSHPFPDFENPPVVEVVLGVQFAPLTSLSSGHLGWFWKECLGKEWIKASDAPPLPDQFETFKEQPRWGVPGILLRLEPGGSPRLQIGNETGDRLIQIQSSRFLLNWNKKSGSYPRYAQLVQEFEHYFGRFCEWIERAGVGKVLLNQWELVYVDMVPQGRLWKTPADWHRVLPGLLAPGSSRAEIDFEGVGGEWHYEIVPQRGRLHLAIQHGRAETGDSVLVVKTTARGPIGKEGVPDWKTGLEIGHTTTVRTFIDFTSKEAHQVWGRKT